MNSLKRGCDCLGEIHYLNMDVNDNFGDAETIQNAICIHEEDDGLLYKHTDWRSGKTFTERSRRLIIQFFSTIANYDYGFVWYFYLDGKIDYEAKLTGCVSTEMYGDQAGNNDLLPYQFGTKIDRDIYAPIHQVCIFIIYYYSLLFLIILNNNI
jgi:primary-amine oxidase